MKSIIATILVSFMSLFFVASPIIVVAQNYDTPGLVKCEGALTAEERDAKIKKQCNFAELINGIQYLINWMIYVSFPIVILVFAYAGFLFMTAKEANISKAKEIFQKVVIGYIIMLSAWLIVRTILKLLVSNPDYLFFFK